MRFLVVEDEFVNRLYLQKTLAKYGDCDIAIDGQEAIDAFLLAWKENAPYDLICMDIMMPNMDGRESTEKIRQLEQEMGIVGAEEVKVIMTTALDDVNNVMGSLKGGASSYIVKPIERARLLEEMKKLGLLTEQTS